MRRLRDLMGFGSPPKDLRAARELLQVPIAARPEWVAAITEAVRVGDRKALAGLRFSWGSAVHRADVVRGVGVIEIRGGLVEGTYFTDYTDIRCALDEFAGAAGVHSILIDVDSPGGMVHAKLFELADRMRAVRDEKPLWCFVEQQATSAAYVLAAQGSQLFASNENTSIVGSLGVIATHVDFSKMNEQMGIVVTEVVTGRHKNALSPERPLGSEGRAELEMIVEGAFQELIDSVTAGRGALTEKKIRAQEAAIYLAGAARGLEMIDGITPRDAVLEKLISKAQSRGVYVPSAAVPATTQEGNMPTDQPNDQPTPTPPPAAGGTVIDINTARAEGRTAALEESRARAAQITQLCQLAGMPQLAGSLIAEGIDVSAVQQRLVDARAHASGAEIDSASPDAPAGGLPKIDTAAIYRRWNGQTAGKGN